MQVIEKPDIATTLEKEGIELRQRGRYFMASCPFHSERTPSFSIDLKRQRFRCFGCSEYGDVIDFIMRFKNLSFNGAISYLGILNTYTPIIKSSQETRRYELVHKFNYWCNDYSKLLGEMIRLCNHIDLKVKTTEELKLAGIEEVYRQREIYAYQLSIFNSVDDEIKFNIFKEVKGY